MPHINLMYNANLHKYFYVCIYKIMFSGNLLLWKIIKINPQPRSEDETPQALH